MSDSERIRSPIDDARALFLTEALPFPPLPSELADLLHKVEDNIFSTRPLGLAYPYNLEIFSIEVQESPPPKDYAVVAFDGHGINSWGVHYYLVKDALALFIQLSWGGAYGNPEEDRELIAAVFDWAGYLQTQVQRAQLDGLIPAGWRLLIIVSHFAAPGWAWVPYPSPGPQDIVLQQDEDLFKSVETMIEDLLSRRTKLA